ncbi:MAG: aminopeptidase [Polyangiales bacterium]
MIAVGRGHAAALLFALSLPGCYLSDLASRQLALINDQRPLPLAIERETDPLRRAALGMVPALRAFALDTMQLPVGRSYAGYYETTRTGIAFVVVGSEKTRLRAYRWWFPIVGSVAYESFVDEAGARGEERELMAQGYDTWVGPVTAYSTLGLLRDPVTTVMMRRGLVSFVEVLLHEMTHMKLYVPGHTDWNEQLASFAGRTGAEQYLRSRHGSNAALMAELAQNQRRSRQIDSAVRAALAEAEALYHSGRATAVLLRERERVFGKLSAELRRLDPDKPASELVVNNARLLQFRRYLAGAEQFEQIWLAGHGSWSRFWELVQRRAEAL